MWTYNQLSGELRKDGVLLGIGYSGHGQGKNNPALEQDVDVGPIPAGSWTICGPPYDTTTHGPYVLRLEPDRLTPLYGRAGFLIHGDSLEHPGQGSEGCIAISPRDKRSAVYQSGDTKLLVISGISQVTAGIPQQKDFP
ncbi:MAG: hypothetical protein JWQ87_2266 [Candidatus Sulfotelmatobacter sp.]|nr:hypothetical protein [Candidatus Sulfotelmatobacter sp.]